MPALASEVQFVIGVDTHRRTHTAAAVDRLGGSLEQITVGADRDGSEQLFGFAGRCAPGSRVWAIEGTGLYGAGLTRFLLERGEQVVEVERPNRPARRRGKSDELDALSAAREVLAMNHLATPRCAGEREALQSLLVVRRNTVKNKTQAIGLLKTMIIKAPESLREALGPLPTNEQVRRAARLRSRKDAVEDTSVLALRSLAHRILALGAEAEEHKKRIESLIALLAPELLAQPGVGPLVAAQAFVSCSHPGRLRSEAAFASLAGVAPIPASSGSSE